MQGAVGSVGLSSRRCFGPDASNRRLFQLKKLRIDFHLQSVFWNRQVERPNNSLRNQTSILRALPIAVEVESDKTKRASPIRTLPRPTYRLVVVIDSRG